MRLGFGGYVRAALDVSQGVGVGTSDTPAGIPSHLLPSLGVAMRATMSHAVSPLTRPDCSSASARWLVEHPNDQMRLIRVGISLYARMISSSIVPPVPTSGIEPESLRYECSVSSQLHHVG